jgi:hypothetical protein
MSDLNSPYKVPAERAYAEDILEKNKHLDFVRRAQQGRNQSLQLNNPDGSASTHRMASASRDGKGYVYPTIVNTVKGLQQLGDREAMDYAFRNKQYIEFPTDAEAQSFAKGGYKAGW